MPGIPEPVGENGPLPPWWSAIFQALRHNRQGLAGLASVAGTAGFVTAKPTAVTQSPFSPSAANTAQAFPGLSVTATISPSGLATVSVSAMVQVTATPAADQVALLYWSYTPEGGAQVGPGTNVIARFGITSLPSESLTLNSSIGGSVTLDKLPAGNITFAIYGESSGSVGAQFFAGAQLLVQPL